MLQFKPKLLLLAGFPFPLLVVVGRRSVFILLRPSSDWMRLTHIWRLICFAQSLLMFMLISSKKVPSWEHLEVWSTKYLGLWPRQIDIKLTIIQSFLYFLDKFLSSIEIGRFTLLQWAKSRFSNVVGYRLVKHFLIIFLKISSVSIIISLMFCLLFLFHLL